MIADELVFPGLSQKIGQRSIDFFWCFWGQGSKSKLGVVSKIFYFHPHLGKWSLTESETTRESRTKNQDAWKTSCYEFPSTLPLKPATVANKNGTFLGFPGDHWVFRFFSWISWAPRALWHPCNVRNTIAVNPLSWYSLGIIANKSFIGMCQILLTLNTLNLHIIINSWSNRFPDIFPLWRNTSCFVWTCTVRLCEWTP